jgi:hypothetical protein
MIPGTHAVVTERMGFMARLPPAGVILQATAALGQANQMKLICTPQIVCLPDSVTSISANPLMKPIPVSDGAQSTHTAGGAYSSDE